MSITTNNNINVSIPQQLISYSNIRFIKVVARGKNPVEKGFLISKNYSYDDPEIVSWIGSGGNYGVLGSNNLVIIDLDHQDLVSFAEPLLPPTFTVLSGSGRGPHRYYSVVDGKGKNITLSNPCNPNENWGNIQAHGKFVVGPGSIHPSGGTYTVIDGSPIHELSIEELTSIFSQYIREKKKATPKDVREGYGIYSDVFDSVSLSDVGCFPVNASDRGNGEIQGSHPIHGSTGGMNFTINQSKNTWHCYRCDSGGGPLEWLAVSEGIVSCDEAGAGCLRGETFLQVLEIAKERGIKISLPKKRHPLRPKILEDITDSEQFDIGTPNPDIYETIPEKLPDSEIVLLDAPPRLGKTHHVVANWIAKQSSSANVITTSHSIIGQQLRIFSENKHPFATAVHLEGKDRCCLLTDSTESCKLCPYYPFDGENYLDIRSYVQQLLNEHKILTKELVKKETSYCPYYIIKHAEPYADYCFTVVANLGRIKQRGTTFIDEDPSIAHFFASPVEIMEATFHQSHISAVSHIEEKWTGVEKYKSYLEEHRHKGKKTLVAVIRILEQMRAKLLVETMDRSTKQTLINELLDIDYTLPPLDDCEPYELIDHVRKYEKYECLSPFLETLLFLYTKKPFMWSGANPSTLHMVADGERLIRPIPEGKLIVVGSTRAELFIRASGKQHSVIRIPKFPYSDWFVVLVIREEDRKSGRKLMENVLKKLSNTNGKERIPMLVLTGNEKDQMRLKSRLGGIAHCSSDENQTGQKWNMLGGYINIFYQNSVISRGIDVDFYNLMFIYSSDFANPYWTARLMVAKEENNEDDATFVRQVLDNIVMDETTNSMLRISPVRSTKSGIARIVVVTDTNLWKLRPNVLDGMRVKGVDADFFEDANWYKALEERKVRLIETDYEMCIKTTEVRRPKPNIAEFEKMFDKPEYTESREWRKNHNEKQINELEDSIRKRLAELQQDNKRASQGSLVSRVVSRASKMQKSYYTIENVLRVIKDMVVSGEVVRDGPMSDKSMLSLREQWVRPDPGSADQFEI